MRSGSWRFGEVLQTQCDNGKLATCNTSSNGDGAENSDAGNGVDSVRRKTQSELRSSARVQDCDYVQCGRRGQETKGSRPGKIWVPSICEDHITTSHVQDATATQMQKTKPKDVISIDGRGSSKPRHRGRSGSMSTTLTLRSKGISHTQHSCCSTIMSTPY